ncbi:unnamed protein product [Aspergillus oryzae]|uniref:Unnamed protein product n=2 Tax=Aspergillus oryzae TaxID=5062 RepID=A0AAN4YRM3_ASPOZ|nr:unnamed protein product [Aspergillus oryzae]GMF97291.1 unnamed protein product [Aspergillus oryzae]GMG12734.1 unnamed protein product [Aspergillus oryzae]GMG31901.1 unnamed protein product [Aspergillus oryzae]GMG53878.1 unnamed protein product [Aspergillus oryzae var. brunneus]
MAANTRYEPAPQRDSFEERGYTQPPPSYQATAEYSQAPRSEDDNVPDDFKLLLTTIMSSISFFSDSYRLWIQSNFWLMIVSVFGALGFMLVTYWKRKSYPANLLFLTAFTVLEAYSISVVTSFYDARIVVQALILTLGMFVALTLFACQTKYDFTNWMPYLFGALWFLILFGFVAAFLPNSSTVELIYSGLAALIFSGYILVDTQLIMRHYHVEEEIAASISLYLDILNLFLAILRILNNQQNN